MEFEYNPALIDKIYFCTRNGNVEISHKIGNNGKTIIIDKFPTKLQNIWISYHNMSDKEIMWSSNNDISNKYYHTSNSIQINEGIEGLRTHLFLITV